jgi:hypothetical protein
MFHVKNENIQAPTKFNVTYRFRLRIQTLQLHLSMYGLMILLKILFPTFPDLQKIPITAKVIAMSGAVKLDAVS